VGDLASGEYKGLGCRREGPTKQEILSGLKAVYRFLGGGLREIRALWFDERGDVKDIKRIWVDNENDFARWCAELSGDANQVYVSVNPRIERGRGDRENIVALTAVIIDIDALRPEKRLQGATEGELKRALQVVNKILLWFDEMGFKRPLIVMSGNGFQLWCVFPPVEITDENRDEVEAKVKAFLTLVKEKFEASGVEIDNIGDLPRMIGVPFTLNRKPRATPERPARLRMPENGIIPPREEKEDPRLLEFIMSLEPRAPAVEVTEAAESETPFEAALKEIPAEKGIRSEWLFATTIFYKLIGLRPEEAYQRLLSIPACASKLRDRDYSWWLKYEWNKVESASLEGLVGAIKAAQKQSGIRLFEDESEILRILAESIRPQDVFREPIEGTDYVLAVRPVKKGFEIWLEDNDGKKAIPRFSTSRLVNVLLEPRRKELVFDEIGKERKEALVKALLLVETRIDFHRRLYKVWKRAKKFLRKTQAKEFPEEIRTEARRILENENVVVFLFGLLGADMTGEERNRMLLATLCSSGMRNNPKEKQMIILTGGSGVGKTHFINTLTKIFDVYKCGRLSETALEYSDEAFKHEILAFPDVRNIGQEKGTSRVRLLSAEDGGYYVETTVRDPETGEFTTIRRYIPPTTIIFGTTNVEIEEQLDRRAWKINLDESPEQTKRIWDFKAKKHHEEFLRWVGRLPEDRRLEIWRCMRSALDRDTYVYVPYATCLGELLRPELLRSRGDYDKLLSLIKLHAWLHQYQRPWLQAVNGKKIIIASPEDFETAVEMAKDAVLAMQTGLDRRLQEILPVVLEEAEKPIMVGKTETVGITSRILAEVIAKKGKHITQRAARLYLNALVAYGVLTSERVGNTNVYRLAKPRETILEELGTAAITRIAEDLKSKVRNLYEEFLRSEPEVRKPERPSVCHTASSRILIGESPQGGCEEELKTSLCDTHGISPSSGLPVPEKAGSHEEEGRNMVKSSATDQIAGDLTIKRESSSEDPREHARDEHEDRVEQVLRQVIEKVKCRVLIGDYFDELARRCRLKRVFTREWLIEQIMELSGEDREYAERVVERFLKMDYIMERPGGDYEWVR